MIGSGPAAGPLFAKMLGELAGFKDMASMDIGGTTVDLCVLPGGKMSTTTEMIIDEHRNAMESVDVSSVGVGGGAIARVDDRGILCVGPESAGASPGPACYGKGGRKPTLTDADVVLGYIPDDYFLGGTITLHADLAREAIEKDIADPLGIDGIQAAHAMTSLAEENIAKRVLLKFVNGGYDPRQFVLVVGGGAGLGAFSMVLSPWPGSEWTVEGVCLIFAFLLFLVGSQFLAMGLLGEHIGRIYRELQGRPRFIISKTLGNSRLKDVKGKPA